jgi:hypothetical protein
LLKTNDSPPKILASQLFFLFDVEPHIDGITDNMTLEDVLLAIGNILYAKQRLHEDVTAWARNLFEEAGLPFNVPGSIDHVENSDPLPGLSVVSSQPATPKPVAQPKRKRRTRRVYLEFAIQLLERGSCTHKELVDAIMKQFPNLNRETVSTFVSDVQNEKYSPIKDRPVVKLPDGRLIFEDKIKPALVVIENPNYAEKADTQPVTEKQVSSSRGDV